MYYKGNRIINCYYGSWAYYRHDAGKFITSKIDPHLCTHISYAFFGISDAGELISLDDYLDCDDGLKNIRKTIALKKINPKLKIMAAVGGANESSSKYSSMAADSSKRAVFISSALNFISEHGFDGLDLHWEYPAQKGGNSADRENFVQLLRELKATLSTRNYQLSIAVAAGEESASKSYDIPNVAKNVDYINLMAYDFGGAWNGVLCHNAPLFGPGANNVKSAVDYWLAKGAPAHKLVLGLGCYGRTFTMENQQQTQPGSKSIGNGIAGKYTGEAGMLGCNEICETISSWTQCWDDSAKVPYAFHDNQWCSYDNEDSIELKVDFANSQQLGGVMLWSIDTDVFEGKAYPLLKTVNKCLK